MNVGELSNDELLARLDALCAGNKRLLAELLAHLGEVDARGVWRDLGYGSMFAYCLERLGISEPSTWRRLHAARMCRRVPSLLGMIERGEVHLSTLAMVNAKLPDDRCEQLLAQIAGKSKKKAERILASADPKPDVETSIRKLPERKPSEEGARLFSERAETTSEGSTASPQSGSSAPEASPVDCDHRSDLAEAAQLAMTPAPRVRISALSQYSDKIVFTMSKETREQLERAAELMMHANPTGDLAVVIERAIKELLRKLEARQLGKTSRPRKAKPGLVKVGYVPRATRREVFARDGSQCTYIGPEGKRCSARRFLHLDHIKPRGRRGTEESSNLRVRCKAHNALYAEQVYGADYVARRIEERRKGKRKEAG